MSDTVKVMAGLGVFAVVMLFPFWWGFIAKGELPTLEVPEGECVESAEYMRSSHMDLLNSWRHSVVRDGKRIYTNDDGDEFVMSLTGGCLDCHSSQKAFCDECHDFAGVKPKCWDCHVDPEEVK